MVWLKPNVLVITVNIHGLKSQFTIQKQRFRLTYQNIWRSSNTVPKKKKKIKTVGYIKRWMWIKIKLGSSFRNGKYNLKIKM